MISTIQRTQTGRRVVDLRQQAKFVAAQEKAHPWKVTRTESGVSVAAGIRAVIGGAASVNPETGVSLTESQLSAGVYLVKQFAGSSDE